MQRLVSLDWDSEFFGFRVGKLDAVIRNSNDMILLEQEIVRNNCELTYLKSLEEISPALLKASKFECKLVGRKITYHKVVGYSHVADEAIVSVTQDTLNRDLNSLAVESGVYSRFKVDARIGTKNFVRLYELWMTNSLNRKIASEVLVYRIDNATAGMITLSEKNLRADIGIVAVSNSFRGRGIGKALLAAAERWSFREGHSLIQVVTQGDNVPACRLYEACGYQADGIEFLYHIWQNALI